MNLENYFHQLLCERVTQKQNFHQLGVVDGVRGGELVTFSGRSRPTETYLISSAADAIFFNFVLSITSAKNRCKYYENRQK
jgi:hypothetical protein